jgi:dipeptidase E
MGETRAQRLEQFLEENDVPVVGMREGAWLRGSTGSLRLGGLTGAVLFRRGATPQPLAPEADLGFLLATAPQYDVRSR